MLTEKVAQNSSNSHRPPSSDGPTSSASGKGRGKKSSSKRGGQKGRRGAHRALIPVERVDEIIEMFPDACEGCSAALPPTLDVDARRHQMLELLTGKPGRRYITEFRRHEVKCARYGHRTRAAYDPTRIPSSPFGPRLTAVVAMLTGVYHLSCRYARRLLREMFGIEISLGALSTMEGRASEAVVLAADEAQREAQDADIKHADATGWIHAGATRSLWVLPVSPSPSTRS